MTQLYPLNDNSRVYPRVHNPVAGFLLHCIPLHPNVWVYLRHIQHHTIRLRIQSQANDRLRLSRCYPIYRYIPMIDDITIWIRNSCVPWLLLRNKTHGERWARWDSAAITLAEWILTKTAANYIVATTACTVTHRGEKEQSYLERISSSTTNII